MDSLNNVVKEVVDSWNETSKKHPVLTLVLALVGALAVASPVRSFLTLLTQLFLWPGQSLKSFGAKKGAWAVVTGATDGIGKEFAKQLAKAGFNVLLVSRSPEKLGAVAAEIESKYKVSTKTQSIDFSKHDESAYASLSHIVNGLDVGVLVNNVGRSHEMPVYFEETEQDEIDTILQININATLRVTQIVAPRLIERKKGLILNIGSFASAVPSAMLATYAGSKGFLTTWSQALGEEMKSRGVLVQLVNTFFVVSSMSKIRKPNLVTPLPSTYVASVLSHIGVPCGAVGRPFSTTPFWSHAIADWAMNKLGRMDWYMSYTHNLHKSIRKRALRKKEKALKAE